MRKTAYVISLLSSGFLLFAPILSFADEDKAIPTSGQCFTRDECRKMYEQRSSDKESGKDYKAYIERYGENFIEGVWKEQEESCIKEGFGYCYAPPPVVALSVKIPGLGNSVQGLSQYISSLYKFGFYGASIMAVFFIMLSGYQQLVAMGSAEKIARAKDRIKRSLTALVILALSYTVLRAINPNLVSLSFKGPPLFRYIGLAGFCRPRSEEPFMQVKDRLGTIYVLDRDGQITGIKDSGKITALNEQNRPITCGAEYEPLDIEKYGPRCTGAYCAPGLSCDGEKCNVIIAGGNILSDDPEKRFVKMVTLFRSSPDSKGHDPIGSIVASTLIMEKYQKKFIIDAFNLVNYENTKTLKSGRTILSISTPMEAVRMIPALNSYKNFLSDKDSASMKYFFDVVISDSRTWRADDHYFVGTDCRKIKADGDWPTREELMNSGLGMSSKGMSPFFTLNCKITAENFPVK